MCPTPVVTSASRLPPTLTIFPYTTLFRSDGEEEGIQNRARRDRARPVSERESSRSSRDFDSRRVLRSANHRLRDRKSTRLNSSHSQISYAVFCLKKKSWVEPESSGVMV